MHILILAQATFLFFLLLRIKEFFQIFVKSQMSLTLRYMQKHLPACDGNNEAKDKNITSTSVAMKYPNKTVPKNLIHYPLTFYNTVYSCLVMLHNIINRLVIK